MSWSDDVRCLYCDGRLPLYRKITQGQFCSSAHRNEYWKEQQRLGVERLAQTHDSLRTFQPAPIADSLVDSLAMVNDFVPQASATMPVARSVEALLAAETKALVRISPAVPEIEPSVAAMVSAESGKFAPVIEAGPTLLAADPIEYEIETEIRWPQAVSPKEELEILRTLSLVTAGRPLPLCTVPSVIRIDVEPYELCGTPRLPFHLLQIVSAPPVPPVPVRVAEPEAPASIAERLFPLRGVAAVGKSIGWKPRIASVYPVQHLRRRPESGLLELLMESPALAEGTRVPIDLSGTSARQSGSTRTPEAIEFRHYHEIPFHQEIPEIAFGPRYASRCRYRVAARNTPIRPILTLEPIEPTWYVSVGAASEGRSPALPQRHVGLAGLVPFGRTEAFAEPSKARICPILASPQPVRMPLAMPRLRLEPMKVEIGVSAHPIPTPMVASSDPARPLLATFLSTDVRWAQAKTFWGNAPRDLKLLLFAVPALIALAFHPSLPKVKASSLPATSSIRQVLSSSISNFRQTMVERAAVALDEDFRAGLDEWSSRSGEPVAWSYDATGFVQPGDLALYAPTSGLSDYQVQFLGMIDKKALSWVVRAADFDNYYVVKLNVIKAGPLPEIGITRYAVVNGKATDRVDTRVAMDARNDTIYRISMDVRGDDFLLAIQGNVMDSWKENRLPHGGVGFFTARDEESRVRWVQVTHQYDMLGRLCAYLAPYNISSTNGSMQP